MQTYFIFFYCILNLTVQGIHNWCDAWIGENILNFGYSVNFKYEGMLPTNLTDFWPNV